MDGSGTAVPGELGGPAMPTEGVMCDNLVSSPSSGWPFARFVSSGARVGVVLEREREREGSENDDAREARRGMGKAIFDVSWLADGFASRAICQMSVLSTPDLSIHTTHCGQLARFQRV